MAEETILDTPRLLLRTWHDEDLDDLVWLHSQVDASRYLSRDGKPWTHEEAASRMAGWVDEYRQFGITKLKLVRHEDGRFIGRAGFSLFAATGQFELGYAIAPEFWGQGYATEIAAALPGLFFDRNIGDEFIGFAHVDNAASLKVLEKIGMRYQHTGPMNGLLARVYAMSRADAAVLATGAPCQPVSDQGTSSKFHSGVTRPTWRGPSWGAFLQPIGVHHATLSLSGCGCCRAHHRLRLRG
ncbi:RimJ/RimL family protein N-acetyltransferase [Aminobacter lissarensis]|uniref:RimJ/RimL family protein N-acetyltransferase n=1 Tax=Aminobacter carboxidus TaxID=376165 RepID=A0A8E1WEJ5_9HYPH|nr:GNAT family N-acetyltransferase [Aminobacter lissarensis]MBB6466499.1 RimJ/RimL family protein N-acetyltransferase [Aminobacter lissarensis]